MTAGGEAEDVGSVAAVVADARAGQLLQHIRRGALGGEDGALDLVAAHAVAAERAVAEDNAVARDEDRDGVVGEGGTHGAHSLGAADLARDPGVRAYLAARNL